MTHRTATGTLGSAVADTGTFTVSYPARLSPQIGTTDEGEFYGAMRHKMVINGSVLSHPEDFDITLGTSSITVTNRTGSSWPAGSEYTLELQMQGKPLYRNIEGGIGTMKTGQTVARMARSDTFLINLGAPDVADPDGICAAQNRTGAGALTIDGALASGGVVTLDVPRGVVVDSGGADTAVITITGLDEYGNTVVESLTLNGTTAVPGKKAFAKITSVSSSATISNSAFVGTTDVLGLPVFLPSTGHVLREMEDGAAPTAGTVVAGIRTANGSTATTGDVRGTYDPNSAADGDKVFQLVVSLPDPAFLGIAQYAG